MNRHRDHDNGNQPDNQFGSKFHGVSAEQSRCR
jgi:hypothetical protein